MKGFTLLEVMIALVIAGMAAGMLFLAVGSGLSQTETSMLYNQAIVRAKSHLAAATHGVRLQAGDTSGDDGGGFQWRVHVAQLATTPAPPSAAQPAGAAGPRPNVSVPVVLYAVSVWIAWNDGGTERQVRLDTEQVGG